MYFVFKTTISHGIATDHLLVRVYTEDEAIKLVDELRALSQTQLYFYK